MILSQYFLMMLQVAAIFKIANSKDIPEIPDSFSEEGKNFLQLCLQRNPASRASASQLMDHPFVLDHPAVKAAKSSALRNALSSPADGRLAMVIVFTYADSVFSDSFIFFATFQAPIRKTKTCYSGLRDYFTFVQTI